MATPRSRSPVHDGRHPRHACERCRRLRQVVLMLAAMAVATVLLAWGLVQASGLQGAPAVAAASAGASPAASAAPPAAGARPASAATPAEAADACRVAPEGPPACGPARPLGLLVRGTYLPSGTVGTPYRAAVSAEGGRPGYRFGIVQGGVPPGLLLQEDGRLLGTPTQAGRFRFRVEVTDNASPPVEAQLDFVVTVRAPRAPGPAAAQAAQAASQPAPAARKEDDAALLRRASIGDVVVYQLRQEDLQALMPESAGDAPAADAGGPQAGASAPTPGARVPQAAGAPASAPPGEGQEVALDPVLFQRLDAALKSMLGIEYPTRMQFEQALAARLDKAAKAAADRPSEPPCKDCRLPAALQEAIVKAAERRYGVDAMKPQQWEGSRCGCVRDDLAGEVYGFQPFWSGQALPQRMDFSVLTRVSYFALPFDAFGNLPEPMHWNPEAADFIRVAHDHGTRVDLVLYRNRWDALLKLNDETLEHLAREVPRRAVQLVDAPRGGWHAGLERTVSFFTHEPRMGDGITVFFDGLPTEADGAVAQHAFTRFHDNFVLALVDEMRRSRQPLALNLVVPVQAMGRGPFSYAALAGYIRKAEDPVLEDGRISKGGVDYASRTNVTLRLLVLMDDPVTQTKRELRARIEEALPLHGNDRRVFLRKIVPLLPLDGTDLRQLSDDLVYFQDNFGGAAFWPVPPRGTPLGDAVNVKLRRVYRQVDASDVSRVCRFVCPNRWPLRLAFELLVAVGIVSVGLYALDCRVRRLGRRYLLFLFVGAVLVVGLGAALLSCDPALAGVRHGNVLLVVLVVVLIGWGVAENLRTRVDPP